VAACSPVIVGVAVGFAGGEKRQAWIMPKLKRESCIPPEVTLDSLIMVKHRKAPRYRFGLKGVFHHAGQAVGANVTVRDISTHGCELEHAEGSSNGENCELYFDWQGAHIGVVAQVVWKNAKGHAGLKFLRVDKESQARLNELCSQLSRQPHWAPHHKETQAAHPPADSTYGPKAARSTTPPEAAYPRPVQEPSERSRRLVPRYVSELRGYLLSPATEATTSVTVVSLSVSGASLQGSPLPDTGQTCELATEWDGRQLVLRCNVVWKTKEQAGVRFSSVDEETGKLLRRTCANLRLQPPGPSLP
jgi:PilZ domain-containing protein